MPRPKKEAERVGLNLDKQLMQELRAFADERGQTLTTAVERLLQCRRLEARLCH